MIGGVGLSSIEEALEYQEDLHFSRIADERLTKKEKPVAHDKAWPFRTRRGGISDPPSDASSATNPIEPGKPLRYSFCGARRLQVGVYRVNRIEPPDVVVVAR